MMDFKKIDPKELGGNVFGMYDDDWALVTAGVPGSYNTMTISWGGLGWLWGLPVSFTFVRKTRHTYKFMEDNDTFSLCFFAGESCKDQLMTLGTKSGRDIDKMNESGLTPIWVDGVPAYAEASAILVCKKLYDGQFDAGKIPADIKKAAYPGTNPDEVHVEYISQVIACYVK